MMLTHLVQYLHLLQVYADFDKVGMFDFLKVEGIFTE